MLDMGEFRGKDRGKRKCKQFNISEMIACTHCNTSTLESIFPDVFSGSGIDTLACPPQLLPYSACDEIEHRGYACNALVYPSNDCINIGFSRASFVCFSVVCYLLCTWLLGGLSNELATCLNGWILW